jgi:hypothetical protein
MPRLQYLWDSSSPDSFMQTSLSGTGVEIKVVVVVAALMLIYLVAARYREPKGEVEVALYLAAAVWPCLPQVAIVRAERARMKGW